MAIADGSIALETLRPNYRLTTRIVAHLPYASAVSKLYSLLTFTAHVSSQCKSTMMSSSASTLSSQAVSIASPP